MSEPNLADQVAADAEQREADAQFILVLQDKDGQVDIAGVRKPEAYDPTKGSHVIARWLEHHMGEVVQRAKEFEQLRQQHEAAEAGQIISPDRERTIIAPH